MGFEIIQNTCYEIDSYGIDYMYDYNVNNGL